ncbi:1-aminocyclopropane-1-carboxylate deaminase/D-cysteine desulfhydrase [Ekhidna sp.]|uniref:1-aminocyclopropane-1-carboxylate deaminase/D-cysteine desulfhydrase n=1 Tax=Ekhidna sp. TaxID=2608089 RepID=UPI003CCC0501
MVKLPTPTQELKHPLLDEKEIKLFVKRDDLIHSEIMGNKWRKLKYNLQKMKEDGLDSMVTMGGAFSNHIAATAAAAKAYGFKAVGIIRGEELHEFSNETLKTASENGMEFQFVDRNTFRNWRTNPDQLKVRFPKHYFLPEGGTNELAIKGCTEILKEITVPHDLVVTPIGTGGTMAGLIKSANQSRIVGISSLKGNFIHQEMEVLLNRNKVINRNYELITDYHFGGYAKIKPELIDFINWFKEIFKIQLDPIYTGKSFFGVWDMIKNDKFEKNLQIVLLHTGGLQGISGFDRKNENII